MAGISVKYWQVMKIEMAFNTSRITRSFALESSSRIINEQHTDITMHVSDEDISRLAREIARCVGDTVAESIDGMGVYMDSKPVGKMVTPTVNDELGKLERRNT